MYNRSDAWAIQMVQILGPGLKVGAKPQGLPGGCWHLELTDGISYYAFLVCLPTVLLRPFLIQNKSYSGMHVEFSFLNVALGLENWQTA